MAVNLAEKYAGKMDLVFTHGSYTDSFVNKDYKFDGVKTINIYTPTTVPLKDYDRTSTEDRFGGNQELQDTIGTYTLRYDKSFKIAIDRGNYIQGSFAKKAGEVLRAQIDEQVTPMIDRNRLETAATGAKNVGQEIKFNKEGDDKAYTAVLNAQAFLDECQAPTTDRVLYVTTEFYNLIKSEIVTTMFATKYNDRMLPRGFVGELDGMSVIKVPASYLPEHTYAVIWQKKALLGANQIKSAKINTESEFVDGAVLTGRYIFDSFVLDAKKLGVAAIVDTEASKPVSRVSLPPSTTDVLGKTVSELQNGITINGNKITGTLKHIEKWKEFDPSKTPSGNFLALRFDNAIGKEAGTVKFKLSGSKVNHNNEEKDADTEDGITIFQIHDKDNKITVKEGEKPEIEFDLTGLTLEDK